MGNYRQSMLMGACSSKAYSTVILSELTTNKIVILFWHLNCSIQLVMQCKAVWDW